MQGTRADLHVHSNLSDGILTPEELVHRAHLAGLGCMSICDHDSTAGVQRAVDRGRELGVQVIPGVELGVYVEGGSPGVAQRLDGGEVHLLGYGMRGPALDAFLEGLREGRLRRLSRILERLAGLNMPLTEEEVLRAAAPSQSPGRPHIARAMVKRGYCSSINEVFSRFLIPGKPGYVPRERVSALEGIEVIREAGGVPVVAHPGLGGTATPLLKSMVEMGVEGIEVVHQDHSFEVVRNLIRFARSRDLLCTGGSDFHGRPSDPRLGEVTVPISWTRELI